MEGAIHTSMRGECCVDISWIDTISKKRDFKGCACTQAKTASARMAGNIPEIFPARSGRQARPVPGEGKCALASRNAA
ncbi:hypothetical protein AA3271_2308 [Gluconobacter japonicus NBRC 3271]|nr:hypothetical protein AA3271_2308 [Gluconobacter japonicus NBRC 3271]